jgi:hypothetical protein
MMVLEEATLFYVSLHARFRTTTNCVVINGYFLLPEEGSGECHMDGHQQLPTTRTLTSTTKLFIRTLIFHSI